MQFRSPVVTRSHTLCLLGGLAGLALGSACATDATSSDLPPSPPIASTAQSVLGVPSPPFSPNQRVGIYISPANTSGYSFSDLVNGPAGLVTQIGSRVVRIFLSNPDKYTNTLYASLDAEVQSGPYPALFGSSSFDTYLLTTYSLADNPSNGCAPNWLNGLSVSAAQAETAEIQQLARTLGMRYPQKKFIIMNWEGDSAIGALTHYCGIGQTNAMWQGFTDWINARVQGVLNARALGTSNVFSGLEFNALQRTASDDYYGNSCYPPNATSLDPNCSWCDFSHNCVISRVVPSVPNVDYLSYSAWQSTGVPNDFDVSARLQNDLSRAQAFAPGSARANFIVGEFGANRSFYGEARSAARTSSAISALTGWGASYGIFWQILDNTGPVQDNGFGAYEPGGVLSSMGQVLHNYVAPGVSCFFSAASSIAHGGFWSVGVTSNPPGYSVFWYGTHNGSTDATNVYAGTTNYFASYGPFFNGGEWYTRYAVLRDPSGNAVCTTNTVTVSVQ